MISQPSDLFQAFREDHAVLGRGLYEIETHLRGGDLAAAKADAERLDREAGAHIAFEEKVFYPALRRFLGDDEVDRLYHEHGEGLAVIRALAALEEGAALDEPARRELLRKAELMSAHVTECGELFGTMGRIPPDEQAALYRELVSLRQEAPRWTEIATAGNDQGGGA